MTSSITDASGGTWKVRSYESPSMGRFAVLGYWHPGGRHGGDLTKDQALELASALIIASGEDDD